MSAPLRIVMWSGPRNLSTALMYAFAQRPDCVVSDEPFYAAYLAATGAQHPMRAEVLASQPTEPAAVAAALAGPVPGGRAVWYQKHMTHHMLPDVDLRWMDGLAHVFRYNPSMFMKEAEVELRLEETLLRSQTVPAQGLVNVLLDLMAIMVAVS